MNSKINIGEILSKSWKIVWKFKVLWIFGILAGCAGGNGSRFNFSGNNFNNNQNFGNGTGSGTGNGQFQQFFQQFQGLKPGAIIQDILGQYGAWIALGIVLLCVLWFVFYAAGIMGRTSLIRGASHADEGAEKLGFGELWTESMPYFWRMFLLNILVGLPVFLMVVIMLAGLGYGVYSMAITGQQGGGMVAAIFGMLGIFMALMCVIVIISSVLWFISEQAQNAIVLEDLGIIASLTRGWQVLKSAWLSIILVTIILSVMSGIASFVVAIPALAVIFAAVAGIAGTYAAGVKNLTFAFILAGCCFVAYLPVMIAFGGMLQAYIQTAMTLVFRRLTIEPAAAAEPAQPALDVEALR